MRGRRFKIECITLLVLVLVLVIVIVIVIEYSIPPAPNKTDRMDALNLELLQL
jgi:hypothetical protein